MALRHKILVLVPATLMAVMLSAAPAWAQEAPVSVYDVTLEGTTFFENTGILEPAGTFTPAGDFSLPGTLVITPTIDPTGANFDNGVNPVDVGLFIDDINAGAPPAGSTRYATNTGVFPLVGQGSPVTQGGNVDLAFVNYDPETGILDVQVDDRVGPPRTAQLNTFLITGDGFLSSLIADPKQILDGGLQLQFGDDGTVTGAIDFSGAGLIQPIPGRIQGTLTGTLR